MAEAAAIKCHCNACARRTDHELIAKRVVDDLEEIDEYSAFWWKYTYDVLQCRGCGTVCFRETYEDAANHIQVTFYPPPVSRRTPAWRWQLPTEIRETLDEVYAALQSDSRRLALMGARTLVDMLMLSEIGDIGSFEAKLKELQNRGLIAARGREVLAAALDAGSAASHRGYKPEADDLNSVMDIVENLLEATYHLAKVAARLKKRTPARKKTP